MDAFQVLPETWVTNTHHTCVNCGARRSCLPAGLTVEERAHLDGALPPPQRVRRGAYLFRAGSDAKVLYALHNGSMKGVVTDGEGREQITGFYFSGELLGMEGLAHGTHGCDAVALEDSQVCAIPYADLLKLSRTSIPSLVNVLSRMMSLEIGRGYGVMLLLGSMGAEQRLATFLLGISRRLLARGYSPTEFVMRMTRHEIGSYLGLKLETVSRMFSLFQSRGIIASHGKDIRIVDPEKLNAIVVRDIDPHLGRHPFGEHAAVNARDPLAYSAAVTND